MFWGSYLNKNYCFSWLALLGSCHTIDGVQLILGGLIAARVLFTWQLGFKGKQPWKYKTVFAFFFNTGDFFFPACPSSLAASCTHTYGSHKRLPDYRTVKINCVLMGFFDFMFPRMKEKLNYGL